MGKHTPMVRPILKKQCTYCKKAFFTKTPEMEFCNTDHEAKHKYDIALNITQDQTIRGWCSVCGDDLYYRTGPKQAKQRFCSDHCKNVFYKDQRVKKSNSRTAKTNPKTKSHEELNKMAERRRVWDSKHAEWYVRRGFSYDSRKRY